MTDRTVQAIRDRLEKYEQSDYALDAIPLMTDLRYLLDLLDQQIAEGTTLTADRILISSLKDDVAFLRGKLKQQAAEGQALREERDAAIADKTRALIRGTLKGYTAGENADSKHWRERAEVAEATLAQLHAAQARLIAQWREQAEVLSGQLRGKAYIMRLCADQLAALVTHAPPKDLR